MNGPNARTSPGATSRACSSRWEEDIPRGRITVRVALGGVRAVFHRPHPERVTDKGAVKAVRRTLQTAGVEP